MPFNHDGQAGGFEQNADPQKCGEGGLRVVVCSQGDRKGPRVREVVRPVREERDGVDHPTRREKYFSAQASTPAVTLPGRAS